MGFAAVPTTTANRDLALNASCCCVCFLPCLRLMEASEEGEINSMASTNPAPVKISLKPGQPPYPVPANVRVPYEITCEHPTSGPFVPTPSNGGSSIRLSEIHEIEPTELEIEPNGTLTVEAEPSHYGNLTELGRFAQSPHLRHLNVGIVVRPIVDE